MVKSQPASERISRANIEALREAAKGEDSEHIKRLSQELQNAFHALSQQMYAQPQPGGNGNGHGPAYNPQSEDQGEVIEGEYH